MTKVFYNGDKKTVWNTAFGTEYTGNKTFKKKGMSIG